MLPHQYTFDSSQEISSDLIRPPGTYTLIVQLPQCASFQILPEGHYRYSLFTVHSSLEQKAGAVRKAPRPLAFSQPPK